MRATWQSDDFAHEWNKIETRVWETLQYRASWSILILALERYFSYIYIIWWSGHDSAERSDRISTYSIPCIFCRRDLEDSLYDPSNTHLHSPGREDRNVTVRNDLREVSVPKGHLYSIAQKFRLSYRKMRSNSILNWDYMEIVII